MTHDLPPRKPGQALAAMIRKGSPKASDGPSEVSLFNVGPHDLVVSSFRVARLHRVRGGQDTPEPTA
jgi:hypothetical protein